MKVRFSHCRDGLTKDECCLAFRLDLSFWAFPAEKGAEVTWGFPLSLSPLHDSDYKCQVDPPTLY